MKTYITHASIGETGKTRKNQAGDQTGKEVCRREWYANGWTHLIRFKDLQKRLLVAEAMRRAAANDNIGYDQDKRNTLLNHVRSAGYDPGKAVMKVDTDCSALVSLACMYAGVPERYLVSAGNSATTRTLAKSLLSTGMVDIYTTSAYTSSMENLEVGDILLKEGSHVVVVTDKQVDPGRIKTISEIAQEVLDGKWGNGTARKAKLTTAGYNYEAVQAEVNRLKGKR